MASIFKKDLSGSSSATTTTRVLRGPPGRSGRPGSAGTNGAAGAQGIQGPAGAGGAGGTGKTVKAMANANQTLTSDEVAKSLIKTTGTLTANRNVVVTAPATEADSYWRPITNTCSPATYAAGGVGAPGTITVGVGAAGAITAGTTSVIIEPGAKAMVEFGPTGTRVVSDMPLDPRDFGCPWNGVDDDLPGLLLMCLSIPDLRQRPTVVQLPKGRGWCSDNWDIRRKLLVLGHGKGYLAQTQDGNGIDFAPGKGIIFQEEPPATNDLGRSNGSEFRDVCIRSTALIVSSDVGNFGQSAFQLGHSTASWEGLSSTTDVRLGSCCVRSSAPITIEPTQEYFGEGITRDTTHVVMFRCTTQGTRGSARPGAFATVGVADIGTTISAVSGTAVWTVEAVPKDYANGATISHVGQRVLIPGYNDHVFEAMTTGTIKALESTTVAAGSNGADPISAGVLNVASAAEFPDPSTNGHTSDVICVVHAGVRKFYKYTGKTSTSFTGITRAFGITNPAGTTMSTGDVVTGPFFHTSAGIPVRISAEMFQPGYGMEFYDVSTPLAAGSNGINVNVIADAPINGILNVASTSGFSASGTLKIWSGTGQTYLTVAYTGKTEQTFTGCTSSDSGVIATDYAVGQGVKWKHIGGSNVTMLANRVTLESCALIGATGVNCWISNSIGKDFSGGSNFWEVKNSFLLYGGSALTTIGFNCNGGLAENNILDFHGMGRTNVDGPGYFVNGYTGTTDDITGWTSGHWGNAGCGYTDRNIGSNTFSVAYAQFSGGIPYRNDSTIAGIATGVPSGNTSVFDSCAHEVFVDPVIYGSAVFHSFHGASNRSFGTIFGSTCRNIRTEVEYPNDAGKFLSVTYAPAGDTHTNAIMTWQVTGSGGDGNAMGILCSDDEASETDGWWIFGKAGGVFNDEFVFAFPRPSPTTVRWPSTVPLGGTYGKTALWVKREDIHLGQVYANDPVSIGFVDTSYPTSGHFKQGAVKHKRNIAIGDPKGWRCVTGTTYTDASAGTVNAQSVWVAEEALDGPATGTTRQASIQWKDDAITSPTAAKSAVYSSRVTASTSATTADTVLATIALNDNTTVILDVTIKAKLPSSTSGATVKLSGSFTRSGATVTRLGTDDTGTIKSTGITPTSPNLNISSTSIQVRITPSSASQTDWSVVTQLDEVKN